jgi:hypothetical protein
MHTGTKNHNNNHKMYRQRRKVVAKILAPSKEQDSKSYYIDLELKIHMLHLSSFCHKNTKLNFFCYNSNHLICYNSSQLKTFINQYRLTLCSRFCCVNIFSCIVKKKNLRSVCAIHFLSKNLSFFYLGGPAKKPGLSHSKN